MTRNMVTSTSHSGSGSSSGRSTIERNREVAAQFRQAIDRGLGARSAAGGTSSTMTRSTRVPILPPARPAPPPPASPSLARRNSAVDEARRIVREAIADMHNANTDPRRRAAIEASAATAVAHGQRAPHQSLYRNRDVKRRLDAAAEQLRDLGVSYREQPRSDVNYAPALSAPGPPPRTGGLFAVPNPFADMSYEDGGSAQTRVHPRLAPFIGLRAVTPITGSSTTTTTAKIANADTPSIIGAHAREASKTEHSSVNP